MPRRTNPVSHRACPVVSAPNRETSLAQTHSINEWERGSYKSIAVDLERPLRVTRVGDSRRLHVAQGAAEGLDVRPRLLPREKHAALEFALAGDVDVFRRHGERGPGRREVESAAPHGGEVLCNSG